MTTVSANIRPNDETLAAFKEVEEIKSGKVEAKTYTDTKELFDEI